jgi:hypothetical protein
MPTIRSSAQTGLKIDSDLSSNVFFSTGSSNTALKVYDTGAVEVPTKLVLPKISTSTRPTSPREGVVVFNTDLNVFETYGSRGWEPFPTKDTLYVDTILHLAGDGANNANNNVIVDSTSGAYALNKFGNPQIGSFNPSQPGWSAYFDGQGDFISNTASSRFNVSTNGFYDFTIEAWVYQTFRSPITPNGGRDIIWDPRSAEDSSGPIFAITGTTGQLEISSNTQAQSAARHRSNSIIDLNTWNHIAFVRQSNVLYYYINGVKDANTFLLNIPYSAQTPKIGGTSIGTANNFNFQGFISNFRFTKDAVYSNNFVVPSTPLTVLANTAILTCNRPYIVDDSNSTNDLVKNGEVTITSFSPFSSNLYYNKNTNGGSALFNHDGSALTGDYFTVPYIDTRFNIAGGASAGASSEDFTLETCFYSTDLLLLATPKTIIDTSGKSAGNNVNGIEIRIVQVGGIPVIALGNISNSTYLTGKSKILPSQWNHVAVTRFSGNTRVFVNGKLEANTASHTSSFSTGIGGVYIGKDGANVAQSFNGYIGFVHLLGGNAKYTTTFTPSFVIPTATANTKFLVGFQNAGIFDSTQENTIDSVGNVRILGPIATPYNYANSAIYFTGDDYLNIADKSEQLFGISNLTLEAWIYRLNSNTHTIFNKGNIFTQVLQLSITSGNILVLSEGANSFVSSKDSYAGIFPGKGSGSNGDYLSYTGNIRHAFQANNFTIECWVYPQNSGVDRGIVNTWQTGGAWNLNVFANSQIAFAHNITPGSTGQRGIGSGSSVLQSNVWSHIAISKEWTSNTSGNLRIFINGSLVGANTAHIDRVDFFGNTIKNVRVGIGNDLANPFNGRIAGLRIINGTALYTANFTLPTTTLPLVSNTVLLSLQSGDSIDRSTMANPVFRSGNVYVDILGPYANANVVTVPVGQWTHIAAVRTGNTTDQVRLYINGNVSGIGTISTNFITPNAAIIIGENEILANGFVGYMRDLRVTRKARYTSNFKPLGRFPERGN